MTLLRTVIIVASISFTSSLFAQDLPADPDKAARVPDKFWGLGNNTPSAALENYSISQFSIFPKLMRRVYSSIYAGVGYEFQHVFKFDYDHTGNSVFDKEDVAGRNGRWVSGPGTTVTWDNRNHAFSPSKGFYMQFYVGVYRHGCGFWE